MRKFKNVELVPALSRIMHANTEAHHGDYLYYDMDAINANAKYAEQNGVPVYMMWLTRKDGTFLFDDRSIFLKDTTDYATWLSYLQSASEQVKAFALKITGKKNAHAVGDIYELDNERQAAYIKTFDFTPVKTDVFFAFGQIKSYDYAEWNTNRASIISEHGPARDILYRPESEDELQSVLRVARVKLEQDAKEYPISKYFKEIEAGYWHGIPYSRDGKDTNDPAMTDSDRRLCQKAEAEYNNYLNAVRRMPPDDIIMEAPKLAAMRELLHIVQINTLSDQERDALLTLKEPLSCIYSESRRLVNENTIETLRDALREHAGICENYLETGDYYTNKDDDIFAENEINQYTAKYYPELTGENEPDAGNSGEDEIEC